MERHVAESFDGIPLHYTVCGAGRAIILIHGWSCSQEFWRYQRQALSVLGRVIVLDLAGHGASRASPAKRHWTLESFARDVETVADADRAQTFALVGHSMGGAIAVETALRLRNRCSAILGVDTFTDAAFYKRRSREEIASRLQIFAADFTGTIADMVERITSPTVDAAVAARIARAMGDADLTIALATLAELLKWDIASRWPLLECPIATINSSLLSRQNEELQLERLSVHPLSDVGHFPMLEAPRAFNELALALLAEAR